MSLADDTRRRLIGAMGADPDGPPPRAGDTAVEGVRCVPPPHERIWGLSVQLYAVRSRASWGIGDLADLRTLGAWAAGRGARVLLVNPLDAVAPVTPRETSPYKPTSRRFLDPVYLAVREVPGADQVDLGDIDDEVAGLNEHRHIDRDRVWRLKQQALRRIWDDVPAVRDDPALAAFRAQRAPAVDQFAAYVLGVAAHGEDTNAWPAELHAPDGPAVAELAATDEAAFHVWQQYCLDLQLQAAGAAIPLLRDLPVGFDPCGFDAWTWRDLLAKEVTIGAPPDNLGPQGQDWELPAFVPWKLAEVGFAPLAETLDAAMRHAGGLRIDHILGLFRLFWIPPGGTPADGAYVRQPTEALFDVIGRASQRNGAWVVGEDLGTVEEGVRSKLLDRNVLRYQVLWFDDAAPWDWTPESLASIATHDVATVAGLWHGRDLALQREIGLDPDDSWNWGVRDRVAEWAGLHSDTDLFTAAVELHRLIARSPSRVVVAQVDDLFGTHERPNVPGTKRDQRPDNWSLALPVVLDDLPGHALANAITEVMQAERPSVDLAGLE
jgi:4-alpha-glucanotransferase